jgi:hypothetical protein
MFKMMYSKQNINNGALSGAKPMPLKDSTSNNESAFTMSRQTYLETVPSSPISNTIKLQKKWSGNRDASQIIANRRNVAVGKGTLNENAGLYSFTAYNEINVQNTALRRARAGGSAAPPKKNARTTIAPTRTFSPIQYSNVNGTVSNQNIKDFYGNNGPVSYH